MLAVLGTSLLTLAACKTAALLPQEPKPAPASAEIHLLAEPDLGPPLKVGERTIPEQELKRYLCWGVGTYQVEYFKFKIIIEQELRRRAADGDDLSQYEVSDAQAQRKLEQERDDFLLRYPTLDFPTEVGRAFLSLDLWKDQSRQSMVFDRLFFPENPDDWPPLTTEVLIEFGGQPFVDDAKESYQYRKQRQIENGLEEIEPDDPIFVDVCRQTVLLALQNYSLIEFDRDQVEPGVLMTVEGVPITIEEVWNRIAPYVTPDKIDDAKRFCAIRALLEEYLAAQEYDLGDGELAPALKTYAEFREGWADGAVYHQVMQEHEMLAIQVMGFPSLHGFAEYMRLNESFSRTIKDELADDAKLRAYLPTINQITGAAKCNIEVILSSAFDFDNVRWKKNGWADAKTKAEAIKKQLDDGAEWSEVIDLQSEFWDPPMPQMGNTPMHSLLDKGRFGLQTRNQLLNYMEESEYRVFLHGPSITDYIFYEQRINSIDGPFEGPRGYYITRLSGKQPPNSPLNLAEPVHRNIAEQYYIKYKLNDWTLAALEAGLKSGKVQGL